VAHERKLFAQEGQHVAIGKALAAAPTLTVDRLYQLQLQAQPDVTFALPPGKASPARETYAGLATLTINTAGVYRIALDQKVWVDVIANGSSVQARDFQGRPGCNAPHKIVEFLLPAGTPVTLQFSGGNAPTVKVTVTRSPEKAS
jgi:hypothetical protein